MSIDASVLIEREITRKANFAAGILAPSQSKKVPVLLADHAEQASASIRNILSAILEKRQTSRLALKDLLVLFEWPKDDLDATASVDKDQSLTPAMKASLSMQRQAWQLCQQRGLRCFSCVPVRPHADLFNDPWRSLSESIRWWHCLAGKLKDTIIQDSGDEIVMILTDWSASNRGVEYSLKYVGAPRQPVITTFSGKKLPVSPILRQQIIATCAVDTLSASELAKVGRAQYTLEL